MSCRQYTLRVEFCPILYQVVRCPDCVPSSSGYNMGLFQETAQSPGNRLLSGWSHQHRSRKLWASAVDSIWPGRSWDPSAQECSLGPGSEIAIGKLACGFSVLHFTSEHRVHQTPRRRKVWGPSAWSPEAAVCLQCQGPPECLLLMAFGFCLITDVTPFGQSLTNLTSIIYWFLLIFLQIQHIVGSELIRIYWFQFSHQDGVWQILCNYYLGWSRSHLCEYKNIIQAIIFLKNLEKFSPM